MSAKISGTDWTQKATEVLDKAVETLRKRGANITGAMDELAQYLGIPAYRVYRIVYRKTVRVSLDECFSILSRLENRLDSEEEILKERARDVRVFRREVALERERLALELNRRCALSGHAPPGNGQESSFVCSVSGAAKQRSTPRTAGDHGSSGCAPASPSGKRLTPSFKPSL